MSIQCSKPSTLSICFCCVLMLISVKSTPSIDVGPSNFFTTLVYGSESTISIYLNCRVSNLEHDDIVAWFKNGDQISENDVVFQSELTDLLRYNIVGTYNLQISSLPVQAIKDSGMYQCQVLKADDNSAVTKSATVTVNINVTPGEQYPICNQFVDGGHYQGNEYVYFTGDNVTLQCLSDPGKPAVILYWFTNGDLTPLNTWIGSTTDLLVYPQNSYALDLSAEENGTTFTCQLSQPGQMDRHCTIGPITIYDEPTINIYPEVTRVSLTDSTVTFTCSANTNGPSVKKYNWNVENVENGIENALFQVDYMPGNKTITLSRFQSTDNGEYNVLCAVDYGFSSRNASARLVINITSLPKTNSPAETTTSMSTPQIGVSANTMSMQSTTHKQQPRATRDIKTTIVRNQRGQLSEDHSKTETVIGAIVGVLMLISLVVLITIVYFRKRSNRNHCKQEDEREMTTQCDYANLTVDRREQTASDINACPGQAASNIHETDKGLTGKDGYANLIVEGRDRSSDSVYTKLSPVDNDSVTPMQRMVGEDGYALVNLGRSEDNVESEYAHLGSLTEDSSVVKRELVGDDGYANLTRRSEGDSDQSYAQLSNVGEDSKNTTITNEQSDDGIIN